MSDLEAKASNWLHALSKLLAPRYQVSLVYMQFPKAPNEAGFLRLVAWAYGCFFESGRISTSFLTSRPFGSNTAGDVEFSRLALELISDLRTYCFHNLPPTKRNNAIKQRARAWFVTVCEKPEPEDEARWKLCFEVLKSTIERLGEILAASIDMLNENGNSEIVDDLLIRLGTGLPAHKYDQFIHEAARSLSVDINVAAFRDRHLNDWQKEARIHGVDGIEEAMRKLVHKTLAAGI